MVEPTYTRLYGVACCCEATSLSVQHATVLNSAGNCNTKVSVSKHTYEMAHLHSVLARNGAYRTTGYSR